MYFYLFFVSHQFTFNFLLIMVIKIQCCNKMIFYNNRGGKWRPLKNVMLWCTRKSSWNFQRNFGLVVPEKSSSYMPMNEEATIHFGRFVSFILCLILKSPFNILLIRTWYTFVCVYLIKVSHPTLRYKIALSSLTPSLEGVLHVEYFWINQSCRQFGIGNFWETKKQEWS